MSYRYKTVKRDGKTVLLHRWLMEQHLGRKLSADEQVHHKNHDRYDNRIENLELISGRAHQDHHHPVVHPVEKPCAVCGTVFQPEKTKRKRQQTCSPGCRAGLIAMKRHGASLERAREIAANMPRERMRRAA